MGVALVFTAMYTSQEAEAPLWWRILYVTWEIVWFPSSSRLVAQFGITPMMGLIYVGNSLVWARLLTGAWSWFRPMRLG